jgi:hypothetical protein
MKSKTLKAIAAVILLTGFILLGSGCVTVGYDFIKQQATVTVNPSTKGYKK